MAWSRAYAALALAGAMLAGCAHAPPPAVAEDPWRPLFDGRTLNGWTPKIVGRKAGDNYLNTFVVADGVIRVSYAGYHRFNGQFGHLFYRTPFKAYRLRLSYRLLEPGMPDAPKWAHSNSGLMFDAQSPRSMALAQQFPVSIEFQILGPDGPGPRPTGSVCSPGTNLSIAGAVARTHCVTSSGPTIPNGTWTDLELEVRPDGEITHRVNGVVVHRYNHLELDPADPEAQPLIAAQGGRLALSGGYIALQSEGHPIEFRNIAVQVIPEAPAGKASPR